MKDPILVVCNAEKEDGKKDNGPQNRISFVTHLSPTLQKTQPCWFHSQMLHLLYINFLHTHFLLINTVLSQQMSWLDLLNQCICQTVHLVPALHNGFRVLLSMK